MPFIIDDNTPFPDAPPGESMGLVQRDFRKHPVGYYLAAKPFDVPLMDDQAIEAGILEKKANQSSLKSLRGTIPSYDQNGQGYCWAYSSTCACSLVRLRDGQPWERLSAHKVGCLVKNYRDQGGWNAQSVEHIAAHGVPSEDVWPAKSMSQSNDTPAMRENSALHKFTEWMDLASSGETLKRQIATALLLNFPIAVDFNWWGHSVCAVELVSWGGNGSNLSYYIWNSWTNSWGEQGMGILASSRALPNGAIACRAATASTV